IGMASSDPIEKGSPEHVYLNRVEGVRGIVALGALLTFITQLIDSPIVKTIGLVILALALLSVAALWSGLPGFRLPKTAATKDD
ncbi:MAG: hypothetical protein U0528_09630, partial [Anaerolineae bacterium]